MSCNVKSINLGICESSVIRQDGDGNLEKLLGLLEALIGTK